MVTVDSAGVFTCRPKLGDIYQSPEGGRLTIAATWPGGAVFEGGPYVLAIDLVTKYTPVCQDCDTAHEPGYPHVKTYRFDKHIRDTQGRPATVEDTFAHCKGLMHEIATIATKGAL